MLKKTFAASTFLLFIFFQIYCIYHITLPLNNPPYSSFVILVSIAILATFLCYSLNSVLYQSKKAKKTIMVISLLLFTFFYLFILFAVHFLDELAGWRYNFYPLKTIIYYINLVTNGKINAGSLILYLTYFFIKLMPFGICLLMFFKIMQKTWIYILTIITFSFALEIAQYFSGFGGANIDDAMLSILGAVIIYPICKVIIHIKNVHIRKIYSQIPLPII